MVHRVFSQVVFLGEGFIAVIELTFETLTFGRMFLFTVFAVGYVGSFL